jgi:hypothetical protein
MIGTKAVRNAPAPPYAVAALVTLVGIPPANLPPETFAKERAPVSVFAPERWKDYTHYTCS